MEGVPEEKGSITGRGVEVGIVGGLGRDRVGGVEGGYVVKFRWHTSQSK